MAVCGFIGQGLIGQKRLSSVEALKEDVSFVVDPIVEGSEHKFFKTISEVPYELIESTSHLFIAVPHYKIFEIFSYFSDKVCNFLIEKPLGLNHAESLEIAEIASKNDNNIYCGFNYRYMPHIATLKKEIEEVAEQESTETEASLMKLKKDELVERAKAAGVATSGTKADIVARLLE